METINIDFKGYINVDKNDMKLYDSNGDELGQHIINRLSAQQIIDGLQDGIYMFNFLHSYSSALNGEESYEFSIDTE